MALLPLAWLSSSPGVVGVPVRGVGDHFPIDIDDYAYQLQGYGADLGVIGASRFDLVVIDYARYGDGDSEWPAAQIESLKQDGPCGRRVVLAYLSIGEAETYRYYWDDAWIAAAGLPTAVAPAWLGGFNPDFPDNYKVRFWHKAWRKILFGVKSGAGKSYLDRIIGAGFDGVYLDIIDAFEFWGSSENGGNDERRQAAADMVKLVKKLSKYARKKRNVPFFLTIPPDDSSERLGDHRGLVVSRCLRSREGSREAASQVLQADRRDRR